MFKLDYKINTKSIQAKFEKALKEKIKQGINANFQGLKCKTHNKEPSFTANLKSPTQLDINAKCCCDEFDSIVEEKLKTIKF